VKNDLKALRFTDAPFQPTNALFGLRKKKTSIKKQPFRAVLNYLKWYG